MRIAGHDTADRVLVIAEIGNNHEGDLDLALQLVKSAAAAGVNAVKFQTLRPEGLVTADQQERRAQLARFVLNDDAWPRLAQAASDAGVMFLSTPFDLRAVEMLAPLVPGWKIASGDMTFMPLLDALAATHKPIIMSTGMATIDEVRISVDRIRTIWAHEGSGERGHGLTVMHCVSCYPTQPQDANLGRIARLGALGVEVGYSDHTLGTAVAPAAVALGARIVEKHFTMDKQHSDFRDHQLSADPEDMAALVQAIRTVERAMVGSNDLAPDEVTARDTVRRSVALSRDVSTGAALTPADLTWLRGPGLQPGREATVIGRTATRDLSAGMLLQPADVSLEDW